MSEPRLDKNRSFGTIHPPENGAYFDQDGCLFGHDGRFLSGPARARGAAKSAPEPAPVRKEEPEDEAVNLVAWARKEKNYPFFKVKEAMLKAFPGADVTNAKTIIAALIAKTIVGEDEAIR